eukprot:Transcript_30126.p1 GENE.Transcript_30126~~Transcript_30126.p1  ORF type:complete len:447 (+),score=84.54 Transcript_30126:60-1400(+)
MSPLGTPESARTADSTPATHPPFLLDLGNDVVGAVAHELCDPLCPLVAIRFSSSSKGLRVASQAELAELRRQYVDVKAMAAACGVNPSYLRCQFVELMPLVNAGAAPGHPTGGRVELQVAHRSTLVGLASRGSLRHLEYLSLQFHVCAETVALLAAADLPLLEDFGVCTDGEGCAALATAVRTGALPALTVCELNVDDAELPAAQKVRMALIARELLVSAPAACNKERIVASPVFAELESKLATRQAHHSLVSERLHEGVGEEAVSRAEAVTAAVSALKKAQAAAAAAAAAVMAIKAERAAQAEEDLAQAEEDLAQVVRLSRRQVESLRSTAVEMTAFAAKLVVALTQKEKKIQNLEALLVKGNIVKPLHGQLDRERTRLRRALGLHAVIKELKSTITEKAGLLERAAEARAEATGRLHRQVLFCYGLWAAAFAIAAVNCLAVRCL